MSDTNTGSSMTIIGTLQTIFIVNKLTEAGTIADWSWWWVLCPIWITLAFYLMVAIILGIGKALEKGK